MRSSLILSIFCIGLSLPAFATPVEKVVAVQAAKIANLEKETLPLGAIVQTIVKEADFQRVYGTRWVAMRGQDISNSKLCKTFAICRLPNADGAFLRTTGSQAPNVGERQEANFPKHAHRLDNRGGAAITVLGNSGAGYTDIWMQTGGPQATYNYRGTNAGGSDGWGSYSRESAPLLGTTAEAVSVEGEVRPLSLTVQTFIRID